ncbi:hypothetical protein E4U55_005737 [Claviceps digitariae]|nr:hypothetical protein E4U55_005737 [Claviceps digitariae]
MSKKGRSRITLIDLMQLDTHTPTTKYPPGHIHTPGGILAQTNENACSAEELRPGYAIVKQWQFSTRLVPDKHEVPLYDAKKPSALSCGAPIECVLQRSRVLGVASTISRHPLQAEAAFPDTSEPSDNIPRPFTVSYTSFLLVGRAVSILVVEATEVGQ